MNGHATLSDYRDRLLRLPGDRPLEREDLLVEAFLLARSGQLEMYYSPHNEYIEGSAKVLIMGLTPGWRQMKIAYEEAVQGLMQGLSEEEVAKRAKKAARFAGPMRQQLIAFLDDLDVHAYLGASSAAALFDEEQPLLHTVSALRFPVFNHGRNYTGSQPQLMASPFLADAAMQSIQQELDALRSRPLIIPLGKAVESVLSALADHGCIARDQVLWGFPHPSGANGHRLKQFTHNKPSMRRMLQNYFEPR